MEFKISFLFLIVFPFAISQDFSQISCCNYCRSEPGNWVKLGTTYERSADDEVAAMMTPPAFLVDDEEEVVYTMNDREYKMRYSGAPLRLTHDDLTQPDQLMQNQYMQFDLASPKQIGGILTQGGYSEEKFQALYPRTETWATEFVVSYSNTSANFVYYRTEGGAIMPFQGNVDHNSRAIISLGGRPIVARYLRVHPLKGQSENGVEEKVNVRVSAITCAKDLCFVPRINCLMTEWVEWAECDCTSTGCIRRRTRTVRRVQACGGARCGDLQESEGCTPREPMWKTVLMYVGIGIGALLVIAIIAFIIYRVKNRNQVEVIVVQENDDEDRHRPAFHPAPKAPTLRPGMAPPSTQFAPPSNMPRPPMGMRPPAPKGPQLGGNGAGGAQMAIFGGLGGIAPMDSN